jgi:crotonobetainyl-CoA:carnitine CoA-transferase CaiB-like acyl-CoA transferase
MSVMRERTGEWFATALHGEQLPAINTSEERRLGGLKLRPLADLIAQLGLTEHFRGDAVLCGSDPVIRSPHRLGEASATAQLLIGVAGAAIWDARTGMAADVAIGIIDALHFLHATHFVRQSRHPINVGAELVEVNDVYRCRDGRYVMLEAGPPYPKLLKGYLDFFDCGNNQQSIAREVARRDSVELEDALAQAGLPCCRAFTREQWLEHPQGKILSHSPAIEIEKIASGEPVPFSAELCIAGPLDGIRVLDFTHVLAGPRSARTLAEYGAEVLHVSSPDYPDTLAQHLGVDVGKRCTYLDLCHEHELATMLRLAASADVFTTTYRSAVNKRFGLTPDRLAAQSERGIICMTANAYGHEGPWAERPGFDQNGQVASGFAVKEGGDGPPKLSPVFYLADLITGYFAAAGMMAALLRRATEGGSYHVKLSLARSAMWVQELGFLEASALQGLPETDTYPAKMTTYDTVYGPISNLAPALRFTNLALPQTTALSPYGASRPEWSTPFQP